MALVATKVAVVVVEIVKIMAAVEANTAVAEKYQ